MKTILKALASLLLLLPLSSIATVIDFNAAAGSPDGYVDSGVTFSYAGPGPGTNSGFAVGPNGTTGIVMSGDADGTMRADIAGGTTGSVSVDLGDFNVDADRIILSIFDAADTLLGSVTADLASAFVGMVTLSVSSAGAIAYATFGTTGDIGLGGILADNFTFVASAVPEPATLALLSLGLFGLGLRRKRS